MAREEIAPGTTILGFDAQLPVGAEDVARQVDSALRRSLEEAVSRRRVSVVASGPSAVDHFAAPLPGPTVALNGALRLFTDRNLAPTYWAACDPQALVADFLPPHPPTETTYLVASQCHHTVFDRLLGRRVLVWHQKDSAPPAALAIPPCCSITITAAWLLRGMAFTDLDFYGWDGCWDGPSHHSGDGDIGLDPPVHINFGGTASGDEITGGRTFASSRAWAAELQSAEQFFRLADYFHLGVRIHGDGMFRTARNATLGVSE